jgi:two-component system nitrate/nitrite response regulator NarL
MTRPLPVPVRIVIADDRPISRDGLRRLLESDPSFVIVGATGACSEAAKLVRDQQADILLLDFPVTADRALETLQDIARSGSAARVIILVRSLDGSDVVRAVQRGARGIVLKDSPTDPLFKSIQTVMEGQYWIALDQVANAAASLRQLELERRRRQAFHLTERELNVLEAVVTGDSNKEIAESFGITENTVKSHLTHLFDKLGASNRLELALFAAHHRLLDGAERR